MKVDVVVPYHLKDSDVLHWTVWGIRNFIDVADIIVVTSQSARPKVEDLGVTFLDENTIVDEISTEMRSSWRWGWYFQQVLKFAMACHVETQYYLVVDADTVFLRPVSFFDNAQRPLYATSNEYNRPYFDVFESFLGFRPNREYSFIANHMVFKRQIVMELMNCLDADEPWHNRILALTEPQPPWNSLSQFSEYETYGHFIKERHPEELQLRPLSWDTTGIEPTSWLLALLGRYFDFFSFHDYMRSNALFSLDMVRAYKKLAQQILQARKGIENTALSEHEEGRIPCRQ